MLENGVDLELFPMAPWPAPPSATNPLRLIFVGRLIPCNGVSMLFAALKEVRDAFPVHCKIVGDGPLAEALKREALSVCFAGSEHGASFFSPASQVQRNSPSAAAKNPFSNVIEL